MCSFALACDLDNSLVLICHNAARDCDVDHSLASLQKISSCGLVDEERQTLGSSASWEVGSTKLYT
jgi:hypothetical protein